MDNLVLYVTIRAAKDDGHEFADVDGVSGSAHVARVRSECSAAKIPQWAEANPIVRIAKFVLSEE